MSHISRMPGEQSCGFPFHRDDLGVPRREFSRMKREVAAEDFLADTEKGGLPDIFALKAKQANTFARHDFTKPAFRELRDAMRDYGRRVFQGALGKQGSEYLVWNAVCTRTFEFGKIAESITMPQLCGGYRNRDDPKTFNIDGGGTPLFVGCGLKERAARGIVRGLIEEGLLDELRAGRLTQDGLPTQARYLAPLPVDFALYIIAGNTMRERGRDMTPDQRRGMVQAMERAAEPFVRGGEVAWTSGLLARFHNPSMGRDAPTLQSLPGFLDLPWVQGALQEAKAAVEEFGRASPQPVAERPLERNLFDMNR